METFGGSPEIMQTERINWDSLKSDTELASKLEQLVDDIRNSANSLGKGKEEIKNEIKNHLKEAGFKYAIAVDITKSPDKPEDDIECRTVSPISDEIIKF